MLLAKKMLQTTDIVALAGATSSRSLDPSEIPSESPMHVQIVTSDSVGLQSFALKAKKVAPPVLRGQCCASASAGNWMQNLQTWSSPTDQRMLLTCLELRKESGLFLRSIFPGCGKPLCLARC
jgi:hypothetical protein